MTDRPDDRNFRLSRDVLPRRYEAHLAVDFSEKSFRGSERVALSIARPVREFTLHALGLDITRVELRAGDRVHPAQVSVLPLSETVLLTFDAEVPAGEATLHVDWAGHFSEGLRGLYLAGDVAATQFEAADARRVFPCFDEPAFKARWALSVEVPEGLSVLSNGAVTDSSPSGNGQQRIRFAETELLPSYLVALVAGIWDPFPAFPPDQVLVTLGRSLYRPSDNSAVADWCFRSSYAVKAWGRRLQEQVQRLVEREQKRLGKVAIPEVQELLAYWLGTLPAPPTLTVAFSGLGADAMAWVREVGQLAQQVREAAAQDFALTSLVTREGGTLTALD